MISPLIKPLLGDIPLLGAQVAPGAPPPTPPAAPTATSPIQIVAPPDQSTTETNVGGSTSQRVASPQRTQALQNMADAQLDRSQAQVDLRAAKSLELDQQAQEQEQIAEQRRQEMEQARQVRQEQQIEINRRMAESQAARAQMVKAGNPTTYWEDKSAPAKVLAGFLMVLGGAAAGVAGQKNSAAEAYANAAAEDRQRKIDKFMTSKEFAALKAQDVAAAQQALTDKLKQIADEGIASRQLIKDQMLAIAKRSGKPGAMATFDIEAAKLDAQESKELAQEYGHHDKQVQSGHKTTSTTVNTGKSTPKDLTVFDLKGKPLQGRSDEEAKEMREGLTSLESARAIAEKLKAISKDRSRFNLLPSSEINTEIANLLEKKKGVLGALNENDIARAKNDFSKSLLRGSPDKALDAFIGGMETSYGEALKNKAIGSATPTPGAASKQAVTPAVPQVREINGKRYEKKAGRWFEVD